MAEWIKGNGPHGDIVLSSRIRLARNIEGLPFPNEMGKEESNKAIRAVKEAVNRNPVLSNEFRFVNLGTVSSLEAGALVEKHLISPVLAQKHKDSAVFLKKDEQVSIMINEEDHIRIQVLLPGLQLEKCWDLADKIDDVLEEAINYAFDEHLGYLTACPTNTGTGLRASAMMHLPALNITNQLNRVLQTLGQLGLAVRGVYGEGTDISGNLVQISNQLTLGQSEQYIIDNLKGMTGQIINKEKHAREMLLDKNRIMLEDKICRSYGLLVGARVLSSKEFMGLLSDVMLGVDMGIIKDIKRETLNQLMLESQPATLQEKVGRQLSDIERDVFRAQLIRERLG